MSGFLHAAFWFVVTLGVLVTFHEFGHYWVARRCGVKVLKFSVGFGKPLWSRVAADGTRYQIAMIPLGGYVQFLDEREAEVAPAVREMAFNRQHVLKRIAIVAAGPFANLVLCLALFWTAFVIGRPGMPALLGAPQGIAAQAGFQEGDRITAVDGAQAQTWDQAITPLALAAIDRQPVVVSVVDAQGKSHQRRLALDSLAADFDQANPLAAMGLTPPSIDGPARIGQVLPGSAADGKLLPGDRITGINGAPVRRFGDIAGLLVKAGGSPVTVEFERAGQARSDTLTPQPAPQGSGQAWRLGIGLAPAATIIRFGPVAALRASVLETGKQSREMLGFVARLITGRADSKNLSGVIGIAQVASAEAEQGVSRLLWLMASLSLTLCIMNLLPIPVLDGGHLLYYLIELVSGRPVGERVLVAGQYVGLLLLAGLIGLAFYNDLVRTFT